MPLDLRRFQASDAELASVGRDLLLAATGVDLWDLPLSTRDAVADEPGCYFWLVRDEQACYKIYIGQSNSLRTRLVNYANDLQIHSANDYKLRLFQEFIREAMPGASLDLHVLPMPGSDKRTRHFKETALVRQYGPLINNLRAPTTDDRIAIGNAFRRYYRAAIEARCSDT